MGSMRPTLLVLTLPFERTSFGLQFSSQDGIVALGKAHTRSAPPPPRPPPPPPPLPQQSPQGYPRNSANVCLIEYRSSPISEGGMSTVSFLPSSFLQVINAVVLCPFRVQKVPQTSENLCPAKLQTRCICCACHSIYPFIPTDSGMTRAADPHKNKANNR